MKILVVAATHGEIAPLLAVLSENPIEANKHKFIYKNLPNGVHLDFLVSGAGMVATAFEMGLVLANNTYDFVVNMGIAGSFRDTLPVGAVVQVLSDEIGDLGAETADADFISINKMAFFDPNCPPFREGKLFAPPLQGCFEALADIPVVHGVSLNTVSGSAQGIERLQGRCQADIETMESAAFFYACLSVQHPRFCAIRAISNCVEPRDTSRWDIPLALTQLKQAVLALLNEIAQKEGEE